MDSEVVRHSTKEKNENQVWKVNMKNMNFLHENFPAFLGHSSLGHNSPINGAHLGSYFRPSWAMSTKPSSLPLQT